MAFVYSNMLCPSTMSHSFLASSSESLSFIFSTSLAGSHSAAAMMTKDERTRGKMKVMDVMRIFDLRCLA